MVDDWKSYYAKTGHRPPRKTLLFALDRFDKETAPQTPRFAADLGCGSGRDTIEILRRGWRVLAIDAEQTALQELQNREDLPDQTQLEAICSRFEACDLPEGLDLINSSFALPLVPPQDFPDLWDRMLNALRGGGRISCHLYGERDSWVGSPEITFFTKDGVEALLNPLDIEMFEEEEDDSKTPRGTEKHWHIFHIVARKPIQP